MNFFFKLFKKNKTIKGILITLFRKMFINGTKAFFNQNLKPYSKSENDFNPHLTADAFAMYFHVPFCKSICKSCRFVKSTHLEDIDEYCNTAIKELKLWAQNQNFDGKKFIAIYFGGGTPTLIPLHYLEKIITTIKEYYPLKETTQLNMEASPETLTEELLIKLKELGFHRISIGGQSFNDEVLKTMRRRHTSELLVEKIELVRKYGFDFNVDILYGWDCQDTAMFIGDIKQAVSMKLNHVSLYSLSDNPKKGQISRPKEVEKKQREMFVEGQKILIENGYIQYTTEHFYRTNPNYYLYANRLIPHADIIAIGTGCGGGVGKQLIIKISDMKQYFRDVQDGVFPLYYYKYDNTKKNIQAMLISQIFMLLNTLKFNIHDFNKAYQTDILKTFNFLLHFFEYMDLIEITENEIKLKDESHYTYTNLMGLVYFTEINEKYRNP